MPIIDNKRGVLVVRLIYDGPPMSGKTTSVRTLARGLGVTVETPEENDGRTMYFDWMDYVGGLFEGRQIRCQVISVPGQAEHARRRKKLLASADAVILVADTRASALPAAFRVLEDLLPHCRTQDPPVGVVLQANKRDAPDSVPRGQLQAELGAIAPLAIVETVATTGDGIREAFVFGVRLALDRVRALADSGRLKLGEPEVNRAAELLARLRAGDVAPEPAPSPVNDETPRPASDAPSSLDRQIALLSGTRRSQPVPAPVVEATFVPDPSLPGGFIWPPVDGRVLLHEVAQLGIAPIRTARGDWWASAEGCLFHSTAGAIYPNADRGREALIDWARLHATQQRKLSNGRAVILAPAGEGRHRLWQLVHAEQALRERLAVALSHADPEHVARELLECASHLLQARASLHTTELGLPCTLWTVSGDVATRPRFVGLMPEVGLRSSDEPVGVELIAREFTPLLHSLREQSQHYAHVVEALARRRQQQRDVPAADFLAQVA
ncbi:MAG TPA: GTPase domain-containing protein [Polyangiales bacterium]|nr:GTPase domain-containing protein [Polyangiales bacterium]